MKLLAIDTSSLAASCAIVEGGRLVGENFINASLTHSQTILPMTKALLTATREFLSDMDYFAVTVGPGSFTGLRIGISAIKAMAYAQSKPCVAVSTLESLACNLAGQDALICPVMDARCNQVYTALFEGGSAFPTRVWEDQAITIDQLKMKLENLSKPIFLVGDGAHLCYNKLKETLPRLLTASPALLHQRAASTAFAAVNRIALGDIVSCEQLAPAYLRLPQAERELLKKQQPNSSVTAADRKN